MELKDFIRPLRKWWWLILIATLLSGITSYWVEDNRPEVFSSRTTLIVGSTISLPNPTDADFRLSRQLAALYGDVITRDPARQAVMDELNLQSLPNYAVTIPGDGQLIEITVQDTVPLRAQVVANALASQLVQRSPSNANPQDSQQTQFIQAQMASLEESIKQTEHDVTVKQDELAGLEDAAQISVAQSDLTALQSKLSSLRSIYTSFLGTTNSDAINTISIVEPAEIPTRPDASQQQLLITVLLAALLGLTVGSGAAYVLEYLDNTLRLEEDVDRVLKLPVIGRILRLPTSRWRRHQANNAQLLIDDSRSVHLEAFRTLKTNLDFTEVDQPLQTILIASPGSEDGKSTVAANLAIVVARAGRKVLLLDADLRRPRVHSFFQLDNVVGLSNVVLGEVGVSEAMRQVQEPNLLVITGGTPPPNPTEILSSRRMDSLLKAFVREVDVVIIDSPPSLLADASVLASKVDGVVMIVRLGHTLERPARAMMEQLRRAGARMVGVVLNQLDRASALPLGAYLASYPTGPREEQSLEPATRDGQNPFQRLFTWARDVGHTSEPTDRT